MKKNLISVLLPVYNAESYVAETLDSLLRQTNKKFEVIAINDGSSDGSLKILKSYAKQDPRITVIDQRNQGLVATLNKAASLAQGEFFARIDADDIAMPHRFELQLKVMQDNPNVVLIGGGFDVMDETGDILYHDTVPTQPEDIRGAMYTRNPLAHGSIMMRASAFTQAGGYSADCGPTEDFELWSRLADIGEIIALKETIFRWRVNPTGITQTRSQQVEHYMKLNLDAYWQKNPYKLRSRGSLKEKGAWYVKHGGRYGVSMKHVIFQDTAEVAIALAKRGHKFKAGIQLLSLATTGRTGFRIARERALRPIRFRLQNK